MGNEASRRSIGATILALLLVWLSIGGFGNAFVWQLVSPSMVAELPPEASAFVLAAQSPVFTFLALAYGATAFATAVGLWTMHSWQKTAFLLWALSALAFGLWLVRATPEELGKGGILAASAAMLVVLFLLSLGYVYVRRLPSRAQ